MHSDSRAHASVSEPAARAARPGDRPAPRPGVQEAAADEPLWDIADVAAYLKLSVDAVYKMTARKAATPIPHIRIARRLRFRKADVDRWLSLRTVSNLEALARMHEALGKVNAHGDHP